jgi:hypothetical protein
MAGARKLLIQVLILALIPLAGAPQPARADDSITVISTEASVQFPNTVTFTLVAAGQLPITAVSLVVDTPGKSYGDVPLSVRPSFTPGNDVRATWTWSSPGPGYALPPGVDIDYRWSLQDSGGSSLQTAPAVVRYRDSRFTWQEKSGPGIHLFWAQGGDEFGAELMNTAQAGLKKLRDEQGVDLASDVSVYVYANQAGLRGAMLGSPTWIGGRAYPEFGTILLIINRDQLSDGERSLVHELTHQLVYQQTVDPLLGSHVPLWLNEGLAVSSEGPTKLEFRLALTTAIRTNRLSSFRNLDGAFPYDAQASTLAYAQSEGFVRFLLAKNGPDGMRSLLAAIRRGNRIDSALTLTYGADLDALQNEWRSSIGARQLEAATQSGAGGSRAGGRDTAEPMRYSIVATLVAAFVLIASVAGLLTRWWKVRLSVRPPI